MTPRIGGLLALAPHAGSATTRERRECTAGVIATTTLAWVFDDASIVFMMQLMRGGVRLLVL